MKKELITELIRIGQLGVGKWGDGRYSFDIADVIVKLSRYAKKLNRIAEDDCNGNPVNVFNSKREQWQTVQDIERAKRNEKQEEKIKTEVAILCGANGIQFEFQGDPRGACLKVQLSGHDITNLLYEI